MPRIYSLKEIEEVQCSKQITKFKKEIDNKFKILPQHQLYIEVNKDEISMLLYPIFGDIKQLEQNAQFKSLSKVAKEKIRNVFQKIGQLKGYHQNFINKIRLNFQTVHVDQKILLPLKKAFNDLAPPSLSRKYKNVFFKLYQLDQNWEPVDLQVENKKSLIVPFKNNQDKVILGIYETIQAFSSEKINKIWKYAFDDSEKRNSIKSVYQQIGKNKVSVCFVLILLLTFSAEVLFRFLNNQLEASYSFRINQKHNSINKSQIQQIEPQTYDEKQLNLNNYFSNPFENFSQSVNLHYPDVQNLVKNITEASKPPY